MTDKKLTKKAGGSWCRLPKDKCIEVVRGIFDDFISSIETLSDNESIQIEFFIDRKKDLFGTDYHWEACICEEKKNG